MKHSSNPIANATRSARPCAGLRILAIRGLGGAGIDSAVSRLPK